MLEQVGLFNDLSPELRTQLDNKVSSFGKRVRYKFKISNPNPDPEKKNGPIIWPFMYTLDPRTFSIVDPNEKRTGKQKLKRIGMVEKINDKGEPEKFKRVRVNGRDAGIVDFDLENIEDIEQVMYLELHPKLTGGMFADKNKAQVFERIDEKKLNAEKRTERTLRLEALNAAQNMSEKEVVEFADAMSWDSTQEPDLIRGMIEEMAETTPDFFTDLIAGKKVEYQSAVKQALDKRIISFDPAEYSFTWAENNQVITVLSPSQDKTEVEKFALWLSTNGSKADAVYKKIKNLIK